MIHVLSFTPVLELPGQFIVGVFLFLPVTALSVLGQWLLARVLGFDREQQRRILWFPLLAPIPVLILSSLWRLGLTLPEILDYAVLAAMLYLYCRCFIPRLDRKQLWIFFPASICLILLASPVYYLLFP